MIFNDVGIDVTENWSVVSNQPYEIAGSLGQLFLAEC